MDNILRDFVGMICHVYIDDIMSSQNRYYIYTTRNLKIILETLEEANMKLSCIYRGIFSQNNIQTRYDKNFRRRTFKATFKQKFR